MTKSTATLLLFVALVALLALAGCGRELVAPSGGEVTVVTTTYPLTYMTQRIGGDRVAVTQLVKPGVEAHDFEPAPSDIRTISNAELFIYNHPAFEGWALDAAKVSGNGSGDSGPVITVQTVNLETEGEDHGGQAVDDSNIDAHVWLDPLDARKQAKRITAALVAADPDGSFDYVRNGEAIDIELAALDELIARRISKCELNTVVVSHLAYGHMAERYGFTQIGLAGLSPDFESGPAQITAVIERINELGIEHILREPIGSSRLADTVAAETGAEVLILHPLEVRTIAEAEAGEDYISIMKANAEALSTALQCS